MKSLVINRSVTPSAKNVTAINSPLVTETQWQAQQINYVESDHSTIAQFKSLLAELSKQERWLVLVGASKEILQLINSTSTINHQRILLVHPQDQTDCLWAIEQALMSGNSSAVFGWPGKISTRDQKRLSLAAKRTSALAFVFDKSEGENTKLKLDYQINPTKLGKGHAFH